MITIFKCLIIILFLFLNSCNDQYDFKKEKAFLQTLRRDSLTLKFAQVKRIKIDSESFDVYSIYQSIIDKDNNSKLIAFNDKTYCLDIFNLDGQEIISHIPFNKDGPDGIPDIDDFFYYKCDSIFFLSISMNTIFLVNDKGTLIDKFIFDNKPLPDGFKNYSCYAIPELHNKLCYTPTTKCLHFYAYRWLSFDMDTRDYPNFVSFSIKKRKFVSLYGRYSKAYHFLNNYSLYNDPSFLVVDTVSYVSFPITPEIYCYNNQTGMLLGIYDGGGNIWNNTYIKPFKSNSIDFQKESNFLIEMPAFIKLIYDPYNKLFYRFVKQKQALRDNSALLNRRWYGAWTIIIFDKYFNQVGEKTIPPNTFFNLFSFQADGKLFFKSLGVDSIEELNKHNILIELVPTEYEKSNIN